MSRNIKALNPANPIFSSPLNPEFGLKRIAIEKLGGAGTRRIDARPTICATSSRNLGGEAVPHSPDWPLTAVIAVR